MYALLLNWLAKATVKKFKPVVVAVTGSVGKTAAVQAISSVLSLRKRVRHSGAHDLRGYAVQLAVLTDRRPKHFVTPAQEEVQDEGGALGNATLLRVIVVSFFRLLFGWKGLYPEVLVLEYAAEKPGDINLLTTIVKPTIAVVTAIGEVPAHVAAYQSPEAVIREKGILIEALAASGLAILNGDENRVSVLQQKTRATSLTFGFSENCDVRIIDFENKVENRDGALKPIGITFKLGYDGAFVPVRINGTLGRSQAYAAAAAACVGLAFNMNLVDISEQLATNIPSTQWLRFYKGINESIVVDDSHNATPLSMQMAIETVQGIKAKRKVAILGDMPELGDFSKDAHKEMGILVGKVFDVVVAVGPASAVYATEALKAKVAKKNSIAVAAVDEILPRLAEIIKPGDLVFVKGPHGIQLSKAVEALREGEELLGS